jgi:hypothetical protein
MSVGSYGIIKSSDVSPNDVEIFYHFVENRLSSSVVSFKKLISEDILTPLYHNNLTTTDSNAINNEIIGGLYNLKLKVSDFSNLGIYTLYIRPKQIRTIITDCGVLASLPSVRGIIIDLTNVPSEDRNKFTNQGLVGSRVEYINSTDNKKIPNLFRLVTSSFYCTPVVTNLTTTTQKTIRYQYSDSATNLIFLTLTPSSAPTNKSNVIPFIGQPNQKILLSNTLFNPKVLEIEMVEHDSSTLANALYGNQSKSIGNGIYTIYDNNNNIYKQYNLYEVKDDYNESLFEVREQRTEIDETLTLENITT